MKKMAYLDNNNNCGQNKLPEMYAMEECRHHRLHVSSAIIIRAISVRNLSSDGLAIYHVTSTAMISFESAGSIPEMNQIRGYR